MNSQTLNDTLYACFQELTGHLSQEEQQKILNGQFKKIAIINYEAYKYPIMNIKVLNQ